MLLAYCTLLLRCYFVHTTTGFVSDHQAAESSVLGSGWSGPPSQNEPAEGAEVSFGTRGGGPDPKGPAEGEGAAFRATV